LKTLLRYNSQKTISLTVLVRSLEMRIYVLFTISTKDYDKQNVML